MDKTMSNTNVHFSSSTDDWATPQYVFVEWNSIYKFTVDVCASAKNANSPW
jgi:hypothetical protein